MVALLMRQHGDIRNLFDEVEASRGEERRDAFRRLVRLLATMAKAVKAAESMAPTRPHPGVESGAANIVLGPVAALMDRTRDTVRKAMGEGG